MHTPTTATDHVTDETNVHPADHPDREIQEDVLAVPLIAWLAGISTILIVVSIIALTGFHYQSYHALERERFAAAEALITPAEAKTAADAEVIRGYYKGVPSPEGLVEEGPDAKSFVSIPIEHGRRAVLEAYKK